MKFKEVLARLTGFSTPVFGVQWSPQESETEVAKRVITFLEDRRVLFAAPDMEFEPYCLTSVAEIRAFLTKELAHLDRERPLALSLSALRSSCRKFLDAFPRPRGRGPIWTPWDYRGDGQLLIALGELRATFGIHVAQIAAQHGLDVEEPLASLLPAKDGARGEKA